ncbi:hypothetical protein vBAbaMD22_67 [Acinetobacter phage vB_AbaM_D22]|nr:hypothetical protein vBAbaMD22_67 [Acinetobacter phage vB_AbaM_D22]
MRKTDKIKQHYVHEIDFPVYKKREKVLLIDADILAFKVASVCETRFRFTLKTDPEEVYLAKSIKEFQGFLEDESSKFARKIANYSNKMMEAKREGDEEAQAKYKRLLNKYREQFQNAPKFEDFEREDVQIADPFEYCAKTLKDALDRVLKMLKIKKFEMYVGGDENFRSKLPLVEEYKVSVRKDGIRPIHLTAAKEFLIKKYGAIKIKGIEADDVLQMRQYQLHQAGVDVVMYSNDKDRKQGWYGKYYNPDHETVEVLDSYLGTINEKGKGCGLKWLLFQMSQGDPVDGYSPKAWYDKTHYKRGYGPKGFYTDFGDIECEKELLEHFIVVHRDRLLTQELYEWTTWDNRRVKSNWLGIIELMFSCAYMKLEVDDQRTFSSLCKEHGVDAGELIWDVCHDWDIPTEELGCVQKTCKRILDEAVEAGVIQREGS